METCTKLANANKQTLTVANQATVLSLSLSPSLSVASNVVTVIVTVTLGLSIQLSVRLSVRSFGHTNCGQNFNEVFQLSVAWPLCPTK